MSYDIHVTYRKCETVTDTHTVNSFGEIDQIVSGIQTDDIQAITVSKHIDAPTPADIPEPPTA